MSATLTAGPTMHGILVESKPDMIVVSLQGTDYRLHLAVAGPMNAPLNKPVTGTIFCRAKRVDVVPSGGRFIEPVYGRPRRLQGRISEINPRANTITVVAGCPFVCEVTVGQKADKFQVDQLVSFDVERGAKFELATVATGDEAMRSHKAETTPAGHKPTEGPQGTVESRVPGKTTDQGALTLERGIEGQLKPTGEQPLTDTGHGPNR